MRRRADSGSLGIGIALVLLAAEVLAAETGAEFFETKVRPLMAANCLACHSEASQVAMGGLRLDSCKNILAGGGRGPAVIPGDVSDSLLIRAVRRSDEALAMPPTGALSGSDLAILERWVEIGAPWGLADLGDAADGHTQWALVAPRKAAVPPVTNVDWVRTPVDAFVLNGLEGRGLRPAGPADKRTLMRRAYFDLVGLPPKPEEIASFLADESAGAFAQVVDRLLASPRYGERWGRHWLDVARYSDSNGVDENLVYKNAFRYRDYVIGAFNKDKPYDRFVTEQIAGDLLPAASDLETQFERWTATGFLSLGPKMLAEDDPVKMRMDIVDEQLDTLARAFMGLTVGCARCHDHKFDPIPTADYYSLYSVFLNSPSALDPVPLEEYGEDVETSFFLKKLDSRRAWLDRYREERLADHVREFRKPDVLAKYLRAAWEARGLGHREFEALSKERNLNHYLLDRWRTYLTGLIGPSVQAFSALDSPDGAERIAKRMAEADSLYRWPDPEQEALRLALRGTGTPTDIPVEDFWWIQNEGDSNVMKALKWQYDAVVHDWSVRGNQHDKGERVQPRFLSVLPSPVEFRSSTGRLELAQAIAARDNPLAARVFVNRVWGHLFGEGIVRTPSDFGMRGEAPTHPALLDDLAAEFMDDGWSAKNLIRRIVLSKTYRQSGSETQAGSEADPANRLLWRQNRIRLDFEAMRDSMLFVAGRLERGVGGPPFELAAVPSSPRRSLYAYVSREEPSALMRAFDFSNPEEHTPQRQLTTVPQQALFLMNSPFLAEQARAVAAACDGSPEAVDCIHRRVLGRLPDDSSRKEAREFIEAASDLEPGDDRVATAGQTWSHGTADLDPVTGMVIGLRPMGYRVEDRLQQVPATAASEVGPASLTALGGHPGDSTDNAVVRRWTAPRDMTISVTGTLSHPMSSQGLRFAYSNGIRGWIVSSRRRAIANWVVRGFEVDTTIRDLTVEAGEHLDFVVDSRGDYESDAFKWSPGIEEVLSADQRQAGMEPESWSAEEGFPEIRERTLTAAEQYAQVLLMTNEFSFRD